MARKFQELLNKMPPASQARIEQNYKKMRAEMALDELREARRLTQEQLAEALEVQQSEVSRLENRANMYVGALRRMIQAMGGELEIRAVFPEGIVRINQFSEHPE